MTTYSSAQTLVTSLTPIVLFGLIIITLLTVFCTFKHYLDVLSCMEFNLMHICAHDNYHVLNETKMAMKIIGVCTRNTLKEDRCSVLSVQNIYSMPYGNNFSFLYYIFHF